MAGASLREISIPRYALRRDEAAASLGISASLFDNWINEGLMPKGKKIGGVVLWDAERIRESWLSISEEKDSANQDAENPFDRLVV